VDQKKNFKIIPENKASYDGSATKKQGGFASGKGRLREEAENSQRRE